MRLRRFGIATGVLVAGLALAARPALAETLAEAVAAAYASNPEAAAARARLRQFDEEVPIARSAARPTVSIGAEGTQYLDDDFRDAGRLWSGGVGIDQALYLGGRVRTGVSAAQARIAAQRARLMAVEQAVIVDTVMAYADMLRVEALVRLNENQVHVLERQLRASTVRFEVGDLTRTDVAQSEARLAVARAGLTSALGQRIVAQQAYRRIVGHSPVDLAPLPPLPPLPDTVGEARHTAELRNPDLMAARFDEKAAAEEVRLVRRERNPSVGVGASVNYSRLDNRLSTLSGFETQVGVSASMPLLSGGLIAARVRQAQARQSEMLEAIAQSERLVTEATAGSFANLETAEALIRSAQVQIDANVLAVEGVRRENEVGSRHILDVLDAEQELLNSRVALVQAERDRYVAAYQLLQSMGVADMALENAPVERYDADENSRRVAGKWGEFGYDPDPRQDRERNYAPLTSPGRAGGGDTPQQEPGI